MKSPIEQEIEYCETHRGKSGKGRDYEEGFIAGLKQALGFEKAAKTSQDIETDNFHICECGTPFHLFDDGKYRCMNEVCSLYNEVQS